MMSNIRTLDTEATLTYLSRLPDYEREKIYEIWKTDSPSEIPKTNSHFTDHVDVPIRNIREHELITGLDTTGFEYLNHTSTVLPSSGDLLSTHASGSLFPYLDECLKLVKGLLQADAAICFDWRYRKNRPGVKQNQLYENAPPDREQPLKVAAIIHSDDSQEGGLLKLKRYLTAQEWAEFQNNLWRIRFINLWRPLIEVVEDAPLAFCDRRTIQAIDFREVDKVHEEYLGENNYLQYRQDQKWYYLAQQRVDEPVLFVTWDSENLTPLPACPPHTSFDNPKARAGAPKRESIEVRLLVFNRSTHRGEEKNC